MTLHRPQVLAPISLEDSRAKEPRNNVLSPEEVARILDRSPHDVRELARQGKLRAKRLGTRWRFRRDDVVAYLHRLSQIDKPI